MVPDGFTGYPDEDKLPQAQGEYLTFAGLSSDVLSKVKGPGAELLAAFKAKYGTPPAGSYPLYGVAAMQVILAAIAKSDGTRESITAQVLSGSGITIPQAESVTGKEIVIDPKTGDTTRQGHHGGDHEEQHGDVLQGSVGQVRRQFQVAGRHRAGRPPIFVQVVRHTVDGGST